MGLLDWGWLKDLLICKVDMSALRSDSLGLHQGMDERLTLLTPIVPPVPLKSAVNGIPTFTAALMNALDALVTVLK